VRLTVDPATLHGKSLFVGTPMYDGRCHAEFTFPLCQLSAVCAQIGIDLQLYFVTGDALVMKARNEVAHRFLASGASHLMMIDSDIGFAAADVLSLLALQSANDGRNDFDAIAAPWPMKRIAWDKVVRGVAAGMAEPDPDNLRHVASDMLISPLEPTPFAIDAPIEVRQSGTGFMMIRRATLERFQEAYPHRRYRTRDIPAPDGSFPPIVQFFESEIFGQDQFLLGQAIAFVRANPAATDEEVDRFVRDLPVEPSDYVSEDFVFCRLLRQTGMKVWTCPWIEITHTGSYTYASRLRDLARIGA
jgi:hypothetical protein